jgi:uncharacterized membrane protein
MLSTRRATVALACGAVAIAVARVADASASVAILAGWDTAAAVFVTWVWVGVGAKDAAATAAAARIEDASRAAGEAFLVGAGTASLVAVAGTLVEAGHAQGNPRRALIALAIASVALAWISVHTVYALRYARLYYSEPVGGIDFNDDDPPAYGDFAYIALTVGMTSQVSDTALTARRIRRAAIHHALLSYGFGTVIVAVTINIVAGFLGR